MKKVFAIALGIVTSIGGYLDVGTMATSLEAGASFGYRLLWMLAVGTVLLVFLVEMTGRLAAVSGQPLASAIRDRFGVKFWIVPLAAEVVLDFLVLSAEMGGLCIALELLTGVGVRAWVVPVALVVWSVLWLGTFDMIEDFFSVLGLVTLVFVAALFAIGPNLSALGAGFIPSMPSSRPAHYWFTAVSILGASLTPYIFYFYSSGAVENRWGLGSLGSNRLTAIVGMIFGGCIAAAVLIDAAAVLHARGIEFDRFQEGVPALSVPFGRAGSILFAASLAVACFSASLDVALDASYVVSQGFGWNWGENRKPREAARFSAVYTVFIFASSVLMLIAGDPLGVTMIAFALSVVVLPFLVVPMLFLMNDPDYLGKERNRWWTNTVLIVAVSLAFVLAVIAIPLEFLGG